MNILGYNLGYARPGFGEDPGRHPLNDGSAAWLSGDTLLFSNAEERYSRKRYQGGVRNLLIRATNVIPDLSAPDVVAVSTCCGPIWSKDDARRQVQDDLSLLWTTDITEVCVVDHHVSHVMSAFVPSGFDRALVVVLDGIGNLLSLDDWSKDKWWHGHFERHSYYLAEWCGNQVVLTLLEREETEPDDVGLGEAYRAFTHCGGWDSYQQAGTAMALAAFASSQSPIDIEIISSSSERIHVNMRNLHSEPLKMVDELLKSAGIRPSIRPGQTASPLYPLFCNLLATLQGQLENAIVNRVTALANKCKINNIVMTGGVALNCLAMGKLAGAFNGDVFVPPAPSDVGQGFGNALWAAYHVDSPVSGHVSRHLKVPTAPFWGIPIVDGDVQAVIQDATTNEQLQVIPHLSAIEQAISTAEWLETGKIVATTLGRSEFGPRALGARSVLADPRFSYIPEKVNKFKKREAFRPFAPAVLCEHRDRYFASTASSRFMSFAAKVNEEYKSQIPAVVHADGTARFQSVENGPLRVILEAFNKRTGIPVLLNTSFNRKGQPIIETPTEAYEAFINSSLDVLLLDHCSIVKRKSVL